MTTIEKIKAEIERRITDNTFGAKLELIDILAWLSTLESEKPMNKDCNGCPHCVDRKDQYGWHFKGCFGGPYNGKFIAEIDECPLKQEQPDFPTTNEQVKEFLATHPKVEVHKKYKTPDWIFEKSEKPMNPGDAMKELDEKIALVKQRGTWDGVDVDKYMDEVRGRVSDDLEEAAGNIYKTPFGTRAEDFKAGAEWQKEQMMKEAVEGEVRKDGTIGYFEFSNEQQFHSLLEQFQDCDKVRIIIVKED